MYAIARLGQQQQVYLGTFGKYFFGIRRACFVLHYIVQFRLLNYIIGRPYRSLLYEFKFQLLIFIWNAKLIPVGHALFQYMYVSKLE